MTHKSTQKPPLRQKIHPLRHQNSRRPPKAGTADRTAVQSARRAPTHLATPSLRNLKYILRHRPDYQATNLPDIANCDILRYFAISLLLGLTYQLCKVITLYISLSLAIQCYLLKITLAYQILKV